MDRFILRYTERGSAPQSDLARIHSAPGLTVLDSSPGMVLVEGSSQTVHALAGEMAGWTPSLERIIPLPDPRKKIRPS